MCHILALTLLVFSQVQAADEFPITGAGSQACPFDDKQFFDKNGRPGAIVFSSSKASILTYYPPSAGIKTKSDCHDLAAGTAKAAYWTFDDSSKGEPAPAPYAYVQFRLQVWSLRFRSVTWMHAHTYAPSS